MTTLLAFLLGTFVVGVVVMWRSQRRFSRQSPSVVHLEQALERAVSSRDVSEEAERRPVTPRSRLNTPSRALRACPSCAQSVHRVATACRHCGERLG
jgi:hypothetical protein